jgi:hypothetical protein
VRAWCRSHDFSSELDETESSWRARQRDPGDFTRLRTICINPSQDTAAEDCRVQAVGGPVKEAAGQDSDGNDVKRYTLDQLMSLVETQISHLDFVADLRERKGKHLAEATITMIDEVSTRFDALRARVKLGQVARHPIDAELATRHQEVTTRLIREAETAKAQETAENVALVHEALARLERIRTMLHP